MIFFKNLFQKKKPIERPEWSKGFSLDPTYYYDWEQLRFKFLSFQSASTKDSDDSALKKLTPEQLDSALQEADKGDIETMYFLGIHLCPDFPEGDCSVESKQYIQKSAEGGYAAAQYLMSLIHADSRVKEELDESEMWMQKAFDQGYIYSVFTLYNIKCNKLLNEWIDKYAETDSSVADYQEVEEFSARVYNLFIDIKESIDHHTDNVPTEDVTEFGLREDYKEVATSLETFIEFIEGDLYPRTLIYLNNIKNDTQIRKQINKAVDMALLTHDEDVVGTAKRVLDIIQHNDKCKTTKPEVIKDIHRKSYNSSRVETKLFTGGDTPKSNNPCQARTYHGYFGIEDEVIDFITSFINQNK